MTPKLKALVLAGALSLAGFGAGYMTGKPSSSAYAIRQDRGQTLLQTDNDTLSVNQAGDYVVLGDFAYGLESLVERIPRQPDPDHAQYCFLETALGFPSYNERSKQLLASTYARWFSSAEEQSSWWERLKQEGKHAWDTVRGKKQADPEQLKKGYQILKQALRGEP